MKQETCCEAALRYLKEGLAVVPVDMKEKRPLIDWKEGVYQKPTEEEVRKLYKKWPHAGVGILTGKRSNGRFVLDCDTKKGTDYLISALQIHKQTKVTKTPRGVHVHFVETQAQSKSKVGLRAGFDTRGNGGMIIMPPSRGYQWLSEEDVAILEVPDGMAKAEELLPPEEARPEQKEHPKGKNETEDSDTSLGAITEHTRNDVLFGFSCVLRNRSYHKDGALAIMKNIARLVCFPPYVGEEEDLELEKTVDSVFSKPSGSTEARKEVKGTSIYATDTPIYGKSNLESNVTDEYKWSWKPFIFKQGITLLSSSAAGGKTTLVFHLLRAIYREESFLGYPTSKTGKVLYITEDGPTRFNKRLKEHDLPDDFVSRIYHSDIKAWDEVLQEKVRKAIRDENISLIVIDTLSKVWRVASHDEPAEAEKGLRPFVAFAQQCNVAVLILHHLRKAYKDNPADIRSSTVIPATANIDLRLANVQRENKQRILTMHSTKAEAEPVEAMIIELNETGLHRIGSAKMEKAERDLESFKSVLGYEKATALLPEEIVRKIGDPTLRPERVRKILNKSNDPQIAKLGTGKHGHAFRFYLEGGIEVDNEIV